MFLAAGPYFLSRLSSSPKLSSTFQSTELTLSTASNLVSMLFLTNLQTNASYPRRIVFALGINICVFLLMALSTSVFLEASTGGYFAFVMAMVMISSGAAGLMQNGIFAYMASFAKSEYAQGTMTGQAIAGVLPCIVQIVSVMSVPESEATASSTTVTDSEAKSALVYFSTAAGISLLTMLAFLWLLVAERRGAAARMVASGISASAAPKQRVPLWRIYKKTFYLATAVVVTFSISMFFPVFTLKVQSVHTGPNVGRLFQPKAFKPLAFLLWNVGDLSGRLLTAFPKLRTTIHLPRIVLIAALSRVVFIPLYYMCNLDGQGAIINSDLFYLIIVQFGFGLTNGYLGTICMMGAGEYVDVGEREATGAFMTLMLVIGLTVGSIASFAVS
jgi:equilibrative nucleoside transporter 1/2/3